jgi:hypothetical protein
MLNMAGVDFVDQKAGCSEPKIRAVKRLGLLWRLRMITSLNYLAYAHRSCGPKVDLLRDTM